MNIVRVLLLLLLLVLPGWQGNTTAVEIAPEKYAIDAHPGAFIPYISNHSLTDSNRNITRIVFSIHSSGFDALKYFDNAKQAASKVRGVLPKTLIIAPQFFEQTVIPGRIPPGLLFWRSSPYRGSGRAAIGPDVNHVNLSAFAVVDSWAERLVTCQQYPRLREIVFVGHSAGGQFVQRYAMVGKYNAGEKISMRYVVSAPSSYAYPTGERFHSGTKQFLVPDAATIEKCDGYDDWGYGLSKPYGYFSKANLDAIASGYANKQVFYLCGSKDSDPNDASLGKTCGAKMQGAHRLQRMLVYQAYLDFKYGKAVRRKHKFAVIQNVGHHGLGTMTSPAGLQALFAPVK